MTSTQTTTIPAEGTTVYEFGEEIDARAAVRIFREAGRTATFRRVNKYRGDRPCFWLVEVK